MPSRFVMKDEVETDGVRLGTAGMRGAPTTTGCDIVRRDGRRARAGLRARVPQAPRPGRDDRRQGGARRAVARAGARELGPGDSVHIDRDVVHGSYNDSDEPAHLQVILAPAHGEGGYEAVDVSAEEPWASLR